MNLEDHSASLDSAHQRQLVPFKLDALRQHCSMQEILAGSLSGNMHSPLGTRPHACPRGAVHPKRTTGIAPHSSTKLWTPRQRRSRIESKVRFINYRYLVDSSLVVRCCDTIAPTRAGGCCRSVRQRSKCSHLESRRHADGTAQCAAAGSTSTAQLWAGTASGRCSCRLGAANADGSRLQCAHEVFHSGQVGRLERQKMMITSSADACRY